jgi:hypothetical protein
MTDIFLSYSSQDRERVRPIRDSLVAAGFDVFWDQAVPAGIDWDTWIRRHLGEARCAVVAWSIHSVASDNVRHEATIARQQDRLVPLLIDPLGADRFPMGLYATQAANLTTWAGSEDDPEWRKLVAAVQAKAMPRFVRQLMDALDAELVAERARRETAERRDRVLREQITKEAQASQELRRELADAREEAAELKARLEAVLADREARKREMTELSRQLREHEAQSILRVSDAQRGNHASDMSLQPSIEAPAGASPPSPTSVSRSAMHPQPKGPARSFAASMLYNPNIIPVMIMLGLVLFLVLASGRH